MTTDNINKTIDSVIENTSPVIMLGRVENKIDPHRNRLAEKQISDRKTLAEYVLAGYEEGLRDALESISSETMEIRLTPTKREQLEAIRDYQRQSYSINSEEQSLEEVARQLLYDVIRAKYNAIKERV